MRKPTHSDKVVKNRARKSGSTRASEASKAESAEDLRKRAERIAAELERLYPEARISLDFSTPWQCLVATILSAQCTDERVDRTTPELFRQLPDPAAMAEASAERVEKLIMPTGFYRQKTRSLQGAARRIVEQFGAEVPSSMEDLVTLPGVGRKTANVIRGHVFEMPGMVVDTHVRRLAGRLGLTRSRDPEVIESDLSELLPESAWTAFSMRLILHGRRVCFARRPQCDLCTLLPDCPRLGVDSRAMKTRAGAV